MEAKSSVDTDPYARRFRMPKWNRTITVTEEPRKLFRRLPEFAGWTKDRHESIARDYLHLARVSSDMWRQTRDMAVRLYGDGSGTLISGVYRDHFPPAVKDSLRMLAHTETQYRERSLAHWLASGRTIHTWRQLNASIDEVTL